MPSVKNVSSGSQVAPAAWGNGEVGNGGVRGEEGDQEIASAYDHSLLSTKRYLFIE